MKQWKIVFLIICVFLFFSSSSGFSEGLFVYPANGQDSEQTQKDKTECSNWAKQQNSNAPEVASQTVPPPSTPSKRKGGRIKGAARGAVKGAVIGEIIDDDAGKGAAIGAGSGALLGGRKQRKNNKQLQRQAQQEAKQKQANEEKIKLDNYNRAYTACLEAKGYTVK